MSQVSFIFFLPPVKRPQMGLNHGLPLGRGAAESGRMRRQICGALWGRTVQQVANRNFSRCSFTGRNDSLNKQRSVRLVGKGKYLKYRCGSPSRLDKRKQQSLMCSTNPASVTAWFPQPPPQSPGNRQIYTLLTILDSRQVVKSINLI